MINKEIIKERKEQYGDAFNNIRTLWNKYIFQFREGKLLTNNDVCEMMALMKEARIRKIRKLILENKDKKRYDENNKLQQSLDDNLIDRENYRWIVSHYSEYLEL
jgi:hypothetical protein